MARAKTLTLLIALAAAGCSHPARVVVGSKNFTEQLVLGEILAQHLEGRLAIRVERRLNLGGTLLAHEALVRGDIDLYPEYTGTALTAVVKLPPAGGAAEVFKRVRAEYRRRWKLDWLPPLGFDNSFAMAVRGPTARAGHLQTLSDASRRKAPWRLGSGYEFLERPDGLRGLITTYGLRVEGSPVTMDLGLLFQALENSQVDMIAANATDGQLAALDATVLRDDKGYFPPYQCAVVAREESLARFPALRPALEELTGRITDRAMRELNHQVEGERRPVAEVAAGFLRGLSAVKR